MPLTDTDRKPAARPALMVDGEVICWRCSGPADPADGSCSSCGAVTIPVDEPSRTPGNETSSTAAVRLVPAELELDPLTHYAPSGLPLGCEV